MRHEVVVVFVAAVAVPSLAWSTTALVAAPIVATTTTAPPGTPKTTPPPLTTVDPSTSSVGPSTSSVVVPTSADNDHLFTFGEIEIPEGRPGQLTVVLAETTDAGDLILVVRNGRDEMVYTIAVAVTGTDDSGAETFSTIVVIETAGLGPGEWAFGRADGVPRLDQTTHYDVYFHDVGVPGDRVGLEVTSAEFRDDSIVGTVMNNSDVAAMDYIAVHLTCFQESEVTAYELVMAEAQSLNPGESTNFATTIPTDSAGCTSFAAYGIGVPAS